MRHRILFALALLLALSPHQAIGQFRLGAMVGLNRSDLSGDAPPRATYKGRTGFAAGLVGELRLTEDVWLSLQPMYLQRGTNISVAPPRGGVERDTLDLRLDYVTLPVLLKVVALHGKTYVSGGVDVGVLTKATLSDANEEADAKELFNDIDVSADFAFGLMLPIGSPLLTFEIRYAQSILNVAKPEESSEEGTLPARFRSTGFQFYSGILIPFGG